jgi:hypothetical protein
MLSKYFLQIKDSSKLYTGISVGKSSIQKRAVGETALLFGQTGYSNANANFEIFRCLFHGFPTILHVHLTQEKDGDGAGGGGGEREGEKCGQDMSIMEPDGL